MTPTRLRLLALIAVVAGVVGWVLATIADSIFERYLPVPWSAALAMWLLAVGLGMWGLIVRPRLQRKPGTEPLPPFVAARTAALALAASRVGAGVFGFYLGVGLVFVGDLPVPAAQNGAWASGATALGEPPSPPSLCGWNACAASPMAMTTSPAPLDRPAGHGRRRGTVGVLADGPSSRSDLRVGCAHARRTGHPCRTCL